MPDAPSEFNLFAIPVDLIEYDNPIFVNDPAQGAAALLRVIREAAVATGDDKIIARIDMLTHRAGAVWAHDRQHFGAAVGNAEQSVQRHRQSIKRDLRLRFDYGPHVLPYTLPYRPAELTFLRLRCRYAH